MTKKDPTEDVLATIARIFEQADAMKTRHPLAPKVAPKAAPKPAPERSPIVNPFTREKAVPATPEAVRPVTPPPSLAPATPAAVPDAIFVENSSAAAPVEIEAESVAAPTPTPAKPVAQTSQQLADSYVRIGPGPLEAIRFHWAARADGEGGYFVDETIGKNSRAITNGPMSGEDAIAFIDLQAQEAFERFERLKQSAAELPVHREAQAIVEQVHAEHDSSEDQGF